MFELETGPKGETVLVYVRRDRFPGERGHWIEIGHETDKEITSLVSFNRVNGMRVEKDEKGYYRALVLKD